MSSIVWEIVQKSNAQVRKVTRLEFAAYALAEGAEPEFVRKVFKLTDEEFQDLLDRFAP